ncbi:N-acetylmuramoyl-L-alanine amidase [Streptomyces chromofuscus]|uniref:N-acetylmuramoyl-L-alanine amidase n=1 Tax=Streptomyces chromofuscus TaxID=42881 RepID=A0A7M2TAP4_STRCW|nr:N-acetylmuramoyl-L-alanine amidase [Streptomyces chromofuscus]QOV44993.1 N-acetylmuramoyl-L-alanine amidase [Streptomyces chromofuscus]GGT28594.1 amidase [Streptomyces chromofuscus]
MTEPAAPRVPDAARRRRRRVVCVTASMALQVPLLVTLLSVPPAGSGAAVGSGAADERRLQDVFTAAADEYGVPRSVLMGVSYQQSRWDSHRGAPSVVGGYGPMHLVDVPHVQGALPKAGTRPLAGTQTSPRWTGSRNSRAAQPADLQRAARLIGVPVERLRTDPAANVRGGAALLAATQRELGKPLSADPADWWEAVARFPGVGDSVSANTYAHDVFSVIRRGARRTNDAGQRITLPASPGVRAQPYDPRRPKDIECPPELSCSWVKAPYVDIGDGYYGNYDPADRPNDQKVEYIVIHDTEGPLPAMLETVQDPNEVSWHYSVRSSDGHVIQHVKTKDAARHSGSQYINARSIGIEHEGILAQPDTWYTEQMYQASARLVRYLAKKYDVPLDRQHIFGHDNVPSPMGVTIPSMHDDPGPFWDWEHYFDLLGAPLRGRAGRDGDMVMMLPEYTTHKPLFTGCKTSGVPCAPHGSSAVRLHTEPRDDAPLIQDPGRRPEGDPSTEDVNDLGSRVSAGQTFAVAGRNGDWTAIWYQGGKAWFKNPRTRPTAVAATGRMVTPKEGLSEIPVYGRALPESEAYPDDVPVKEESPLPYSLLTGQRYVTQDRVAGSHVDKADSDGEFLVVRGDEEYYEIQFGHRIAYVKASDVDVVNGHTAAGSPSRPRK